MTNDDALVPIADVDNMDDRERQKRLPCVLPPETEASILKGLKPRLALRYPELATSAYQVRQLKRASSLKLLMARNYTS